MHRIQEIEHSAPLINVLVVNQQDRLPSKGAGSFMATRFGNQRLASDSYKKQHSAKWPDYFGRAAAEVYAFSPAQWSALYKQVVGTTPHETRMAAERAKR